VTINGGSGGSPATVSFPGAYKGNDKGIAVNIYTGISAGYTIPGAIPNVFLYFMLIDDWLLGPRPYTG
jgi:hypothetical protein